MFHSRVRHQQTGSVETAAALRQRRLLVLNAAVCGVIWALGMLCLVPRPWTSAALVPAALTGIGATAVSMLSVYLSVLFAERAARAARSRERDEALGRLAGGVAHDFNNLFTIIIGNADGLREQAELPEGIHTRLTELRLAARRGAELVWQLLAIAGRQRLEPQSVDLTRYLKEAEPRLRRELSSRSETRIELRLHLAADGCLVDVDLMQLGPVLTHLISNAHDSMPKGGVLTLSTGRAVRRTMQSDFRPFVVLCVQDTGIGMDRETLIHAHEPFFTTKPAGNGGGLGLAIVKGIVEQSGGFIEVESSLGSGTSVRVYLPLLTELDAAKSDVIEPGAAKSSSTELSAEKRQAVSRVVAQARIARRVLVVEDEPGVRAVVVRTLRSAGHTVLAAEDGMRALELLAAERTPIDLLVTDVRMPRMGGPDLARELWGAQPRLPVLFMSGHTFGCVVPEGEGRTAFLAKPFSAEVLIEKVVEVLQDAQPPTSSGGFPNSQTISARPDNLV